MTVSKFRSLGLERSFAARLSRRQLVRRSVAFGLSLSAVASLLAACVEIDDVPADEPAAQDDAATYVLDDDVDEDDGDDAEPIRFMTTREYAYMYGMAVVIEHQLEDAGFNVEVDIVDWATMVERRNDATAWDMFTTHIAFRIDPIQMVFHAGHDLARLVGH